MLKGYLKRCRTSLYVLLFAASHQIASAEEFFSLVQDGKAECVIVIPDQPEAAVTASVQELNYWIKQISGAELPVKTAAQWDGRERFVAIGESELTRSKGWTVQDLDAESTRVVIEKDAIGLLGKTRFSKERQGSGVYFAVLDLVRRSMGVRWIWPGELGEIFEPSKDIRIATGGWTWKPRIPLLRKMRNIASPERVPERLQHFAIPTERLTSPGFEKRYQAQEKWLLRERMGLTALIPFGEELVPLTFGETNKDWWERFGKTHPDWFAKPPAGITQQGGKGVKLNLSNPEVQEHIFATWKRKWDTNPARSKILNLSPNDSRGFDTRPETRAWDAPELHSLPDQEIWNGMKTVLTDRHLRFWNILARRVREVDPEAKVNSLAYRNYRNPPLVEQAEPNVIIAYVGGEGFYPDEPGIVIEWKEWSKKGVTGKIWRPNLLHTGHGIPYLYTKRLFEDFRNIESDGLLGTDFDAMVGNWAGQGLNYYLLAEMHWRPDASYDELVGEYYQAFGPAAKAVEDYHRYFEEVTSRGPQLLKERHLVPYETWGGWWQGHIRLVPILLSPEVLEEAEAFLIKAENDTKDAAPAYRARVAFMRKGFDHTRLMAETFRSLGLDNPSKRIDFAKHRAVLQPLWDMRQSLLTDLVIPVDWLLFQEQRQLGIWQAFLKGKNEGKERTFPLKAGWKIKLDPRDEGLKVHGEPPSEGEWLDVEVAKPWRQSLPDLAEGKESQIKVVWYRLNFEVPPLEDTQHRVRIRFGSADAEVHLWVNGKAALERTYPQGGNYDSWKESFDADISAFVKEGPDNQLLIRVRSEKDTAGITGDVSLITGD